MTSILILLSLLTPASASSFLQKVDTHAEVEASLLAEFASTVRPSAANNTIFKLEDALRPLYVAVAHKTDGTLQHTVVRFVLHRFFAQRGWFIRGLEPGTGKAKVAWGSAGDSLQALQEWVPAYLENFLMQLAGGRGIRLRELAILAATLEDLIHKEAIKHLEFAFHALELPLSVELDKQQISDVLQVFIMIYIGGGKCALLGESPTRADVRRAQTQFQENSPEWESVLQWVGTRLVKVHPDVETLDFGAMVSIVEEIGVSYVTYAQKECANLKETLLGFESPKPGRVLLRDFYKKGKASTFSFAEKVEYLRALGALDETDPKQPHVIITNYVSARPNCEVTSDFYAICCSNGCEDLMANLENFIGSEMASPEQITQLVSALPSDTVAAPRFLSATLKRRLHSIAENNAGMVPLHGRLFAQWMHHSFPRECPLPHKDGTSYPQTPDEWIKTSGHASSKASAEEMEALDDHGIEEKPQGAEASNHYHFEVNELAWSEAEVLIRGHGGSERKLPQGLWCSVSAFTVPVSMTAVLVWAWRPLLSGTDLQGSSFKSVLGKAQPGSKDEFGKMA